MERYTINGQTYTQRTLVLGQIGQLLEAMRGVSFPAGAGVAQVAGLIGDRLARCAAVVLQPEGVLHRDKDLAALEAEFTEHLDIVTTEKVIDDFFALTPAAAIAKLFGRLRGLIVLAPTTGGIGSTPPSSSSPEETSPNETPSSGDTP
ncbi:hypothetical protein [Desulfobulbus elongatus]|uniref:hypothetical protein n=1 Tax=Desulfobulbus elongatus TaxID=53332 RepID=UPI000483E3C5|nr:hypothetical protein [Desulfobulbus elongatus]